MKQNEVLAYWTCQIALSKLGAHEATGHNDGPFIRALQRWLANGSKWMDGQPWCATFATWCLYEAARTLGLTPIIKKDGSSSDLYRQASKLGLLLDAPIKHCIGLMKGDGGTIGKSHHHTFLVLDVFNDGTVLGVDGNWQNAVSKTHHRIVECDFMGIA